jgi:hypothetical protein
MLKRFTAELLGTRRTALVPWVMDEPASPERLQQLSQSETNQIN